MQITYLGHAGFVVETESSIIVMDPWLSSSGAFDYGWFQYPRNHHLADYVQELLATSSKEKYIYISHEHKDHFDPLFLNSLRSRDFTILLANFQRSIVKAALEKSNYQCKKIISLNDDEEFNFADGSLHLFVIDAELGDSAILVKNSGKSFFNLNDCQIHDRLGAIVRKHGHADILSGQFSGAIWHPTCYEMSKDDYQRISREKSLVKFELISRAIQTVKPSLFLPSAGPPCFLDPMLIEKNFEKINIFPRAPKLLSFLDKHCKTTETTWSEIMPGDTLDANTLQFVKLAPNRVNDQDFEQYIRAYASDYQKIFQQRALENQKVSPREVFIKLRTELEKKLRPLKLVNDKITTPLYWQIDGHSEMYLVDLKEKTLTVTNEIQDPNNFYKISAPAWIINKVLNKELDWRDFALSFRAKLSRNPDVYHSLIHSFLVVQAEDLERCCELISKYHAKKERIIVESEGKRYSILRWCPHQGGDLKCGWIENGNLVCPRHRWQYNLKDHGKCVNNDDSIHAICLDDKNVHDEKVE